MHKNTLHLPGMIPYAKDTGYSTRIIECTKKMCAKRYETNAYAPSSSEIISRTMQVTLSAPPWFNASCTRIAASLK